MTLRPAGQATTRATLTCRAPSPGSTPAIVHGILGVQPA